MPLNPAPIRRRACSDAAIPLRTWLRQLPEPALLLRSGRIVCCNEAGRALLGTDEAALLGRPLLPLFDAASATASRRGLARLRQPGAVWRATDQQLLQGDGSSRLVDISVAVVGNRQPASRLVLLHDVTDRHQQQLALSRSQRQLRQLVLGWDAAREDDRRRTAQELHNELMQSLAAIRIDLDAIAGRLSPDQECTAALLAKVSEVALSAMDSTRRLVNGLQPPMIEDLGIEAALEALLSEFARCSGHRCVLLTDTVEVDRSGRASVDTCLYRVLEACLSNIGRRPGITCVEVRLKRSVDGAMVMTVHDDAPLAASQADELTSVSLLGMQERLRAVGGSLAMVASDDRGTTIEAAIPGSVRGAEAPVRRQAIPPDAGQGPPPARIDDPSAASPGRTRAR